jgi:hypothetical protein
MGQESYEYGEVEAARGRVADDLLAVADSANVIGRAKEAVQDRVSRATGAISDTVSGAGDAVSSTVGGAAGAVSDTLGRTKGLIGRLPLDNPLAMLFGGFAVGFLAGIVLPVTDFENTRIGPIADTMKDKVTSAGLEAVRVGTGVIKDTIDDSKDTVVSNLRENVKEAVSGESQSNQS